MTTEQNKDYSVSPGAYERFMERMGEMTFGKAVRAHRFAEEWTQEVCAKKLGIPKQLLSEYERGIKIPSVRKAYDIGEILGILPEMAVMLAVNDQLKRDGIP